MNQLIHMNDLVPGQRAKVLRLDVAGGMRRRLLDLGLV